VIEWSRTRLTPQERAESLAALTPPQKEQLRERDYVFARGIGVLWMAPDGALRRARFTHGTHFETVRGEFYIDSEGSVRELLRAEPTEGRPGRPVALFLGQRVLFDRDAGTEVQLGGAEHLIIREDDVLAVLE
jgi:hypothetical protein